MQVFVGFPGETVQSVHACCKGIRGLENFTYFDCVVQKMSRSIIMD